MAAVSIENMEKRSKETTSKKPPWKRVLGWFLIAGGVAVCLVGWGLIADLYPSTGPKAFLVLIPMVILSGLLANGGWKLARR